MPRVLEDKLGKCGVALYCLEEESKAFPQVIVKLFDQEGTAWQEGTAYQNFVIPIPTPTLSFPKFPTPTLTPDSDSLT